MKWIVKHNSSQIGNTGDHLTQYWLEKEGWPNILLSSDDEEDFIELAERLNSESLLPAVEATGLEEEVLTKEQFVKWFYSHTPYWPTPDQVYDMITTDYLDSGKMIQKVINESRSKATLPQPKEDSYWKQRCEAAENLLKVMDKPINNAAAKDNSHFELFMERHNKYQQLKQREGL